ncbi:MAG: efflux RND transporter periplasmic adaptor subunit [Alloprevotella sp.]
MKRILYLALGAALVACSNDKSAGQGAGVSEYAVQTVATSTAELSTKYPATIKGVQDIEIRPKVSGNITRQLVDEGDFVQAGQVLFVIDPTQYQAAVDQAQAAVKVAKANVSTQQLTVANKKALLDKQIISQYDYDVAANTLLLYEAQLGQAQASLRSAKDQLSFCSVRATSAGVIGEIPYRVGSLVSASIAQPLTTVSNLDKMYAYFSMTEKQFLQLTRENGGSEAARLSLPDVTLILADGTVYGELGKVTSFSGVIDPTTGSLQMRATFANPDRLLRSGATGVLQFPVRKAEAIVIPQKATYAIQDKRFVYVVGKDNKVKNTEITVLEQNDGTNFVVTSGLKAGDRLVVEGVNKLKNGMEIKPITVAESEAQRQKSKEHMATKAMPGQ